MKFDGATGLLGIVLAAGLFWVAYELGKRQALW